MTIRARETADMERESAGIVGRVGWLDQGF